MAHLYTDLMCECDINLNMPMPRHFHGLWNFCTEHKYTCQSVGRARVLMCVMQECSIQSSALCSSVMCETRVCFLTRTCFSLVKHLNQNVYGWRQNAVVENYNSINKTESSGYPKKLNSWNC